MTWVVVVADRVAEAGLTLLRQAPGVEVVSVVGNDGALRHALPRAHALLVRSDTLVTADLAPDREIDLLRTARSWGLVDASTIGLPREASLAYRVAINYVMYAMTH